MDSRIQTRIAQDLFFRKGYMYQVQGDLRAAAECYLQSIQQDPNPEAHTLLGWVLSQLGDLEHAIEECHKALRLDPSFGNAWNDLGCYFTEKREFDAAVGYLKKACKMKNYDSPEFPYYNLAKISIFKGHLIQARKELTQSLKKNPNFEPAKQLLAQIDRSLH